MEMTHKRILHKWTWAVQCCLGAIGLAVITVVCFHFGAELATTAFAYLLFIVPLSLLGSFTASLILSIAAAACLNYFFTQPLFDFRIEYLGDALAVAAFATTTLIVTALTTKVRQALMAARASHQALADTVPALVWTALPDGSRDFHNRRWLEFSGTSAVDAKGDGWVSLYDPEDRDKILEKWRAAVATGTMFEVEAHARHATGEYRAVLLRAAPLRDEGGMIVKWYGVTIDVEDRRRAMEALHASDEQLERAREELARVSRPIVLGQLAASIAHEVNQPITAARNNASAALRFLGRKPPDLEEVREALGCVVRDTGRAGDIIGRARDQIKSAPTRQERFDINGAINEVIAVARSEATRNGISIETRFANESSPVQGDRVQLQQAMLNLILNAIEAMSSDGDGSRKLSISTEQGQSDGVLISVRDSGPGIDPEDIERVFDSFYSTKSIGLGMGLSICRSIVEAHGGRLWAGSNEPRGAAFEFTLPAAPKDS
ncbi:MAG TPA: ATP-binding protein [Stellaceae bacterium]|nr:ATP-binding protein [Stellaceae bacterium]